MRKKDKEQNRFQFGRNWEKFLHLLDEERIYYAEQSLKSMLDVQNLKGKSFLDIGSGSGLFSLAARRLGARVYSFDCDPVSVNCTNALKQRYFSFDNQWQIVKGSVLDLSFLRSLGHFDIVYAWGVLHHTGDMWQALNNIDLLVANEGKLFISIYNDQDYKSGIFRIMKKTYVNSPYLIKIFIAICYFFFLVIKGFLKDIFLLQNPVKRYKDKKKSRGMSIWYDCVDWIGGYPFEVAKPEEIFALYKEKGFILERLKTCGGGTGCNEFVFLKKSNK